MAAAGSSGYPGEQGQAPGFTPTGAQGGMALGVGSEEPGGLSIWQNFEESSRMGQEALQACLRDYRAEAKGLFVLLCFSFLRGGAVNGYPSLFFKR